MATEEVGRTTEGYPRIKRTDGKEVPLGKIETVPV